MARRSFSLMLAWRYLNPRRAMLSAVTLISVTGVLLGVLVLVLVMSVMAGLEREVKGRLLGFAPHVKLQFVPDERGAAPIVDWRPIADQVKNIKGVQSATGLVQEYVLMIDVGSKKRPVYFRGLDTQDPSQVAGIERMLDSDYPGSSADMGLDNRVVVSSTLARQFRLQVGDKVKFFSAQNIQEIERINNITSRPPVREEFKAEFTQARELLKSSFESRDGKLFLKNEAYNALLEPISVIFDQEIRDAEREILGQFMAAFDSEEDTPEGLLFEPGFPEKASGILDELDKLDMEKVDLDLLRNFKEIVLPKEAEVIGVYAASQMALTPDVFMPLPLAQELSGLKGAVQGISVRLDDAYQADQKAEELAAVMPPGWETVTWMEDMRDFSTLISQQRMMMYFALSFIMLVSAFSMMAVMFTVTIQKRREIGVMKALGAAPGQIVGVFVYQGMILGFFGSILGVVLALVVIRYRAAVQELLRLFGFDPFSKSLLGLDALPAHVDPEEVVKIAVAAFILCALAAFVPAYAAARSDAAKSLRNL